MSHKAGFVNIIGNPNVGKSTLMNALVGEKISIITRKSQTTRHRILGVVSGEDFQIVFSDTPGILNPHYKLQQCMLNQVEGALTDADVYLVVTDLGETLKNSEILNKIKHSTTPTIVVINKVDNATQEKVIEIINRWKEILPNAEVVPCSALHKIGVERVMELVKEKLPISPAYYDKDMLTDKSMRFLVSEIIREKILLRYEKEIPYSTEVMVEEYLEGENLNKIRAVIFTERESQKRIIIVFQKVY
ncbi:MAG: GTPase Era [Bacteroidales bacterium]|nr:GTPase Era [Bacteroidales bacterium]